VPVKIFILKSIGNKIVVRNVVKWVSRWTGNGAGLRTNAHRKIDNYLK
jgi:hypothetical protein